MNKVYLVIFTSCLFVSMRAFAQINQSNLLQEDLSYSDQSQHEKATKNVEISVIEDDDAEILVDNIYIGRGHVITEISLGKHIITAQKENCNKREQEYEITKEGANQILIDAPVPLKAYIIVNSTPSGALIYVDKKYTKQTTPAKIAIMEGNHEITVSLDKYADERTNISILEYQTKDVSFELKKSIKTSFTSNYPNVSLYVDGDSVGVMPISIELSPASHTVTAYKYGYKGKSITIEPSIENNTFNVEVKALNNNKVSKVQNEHYNSGKIKIDWFSIGVHAGHYVGLDASAFDMKFNWFELRPCVWTLEMNLLKNKLDRNDAAKTYVMLDGKDYYKVYTPKSGFRVSYCPQILFHIPIGVVDMYFGGGPLIAWSKNKWKEETVNQYGLPSSDYEYTDSKPSSNRTKDKLWFTAELGVDWSATDVSDILIFIRYENGIYGGVCWRLGNTF